MAGDSVLTHWTNTTKELGIEANIEDGLNIVSEYFDTEPVLVEKVLADLLTIQNASDSTKAEINNWQGIYSYYYREDNTEAIKYLRVAQDYAIRGKDTTQVVEYTLAETSIYYNMDSMDLFVKYNDLLYDRYHQSNDPRVLVPILCNVSISYQRTDILKSIEMAQLAAEVLYANPYLYIEIVSNPYNLLFQNYSRLNDWDNAEKYNAIDLELLDDIPMDQAHVSRIMAWRNRATILNELGQIEESEKYLIKAYDYIKSSELIEIQALVLSVLDKLGDHHCAKTYAKCKKYFDQLETEARKWDSQFFINKANAHRARYLYNKGRYKEARQYAKNVLENVETTDDFMMLSEAYLLNYEINKGMNRSADALHYHEEWKAIEDSLYRQRVLDKATETRLQFHFDNKSLQDSLAYEKTLRDTEEAKNRLQSRNNWLLAGAGGLLLLSIVAFMMYNYVRRKNALITQQKEELQQLNAVKDRLMSIIGHDLRRPALAFRHISDKVRLLLRKKEYDTLLQLGNTIQASASSLNQNLENLLSWSTLGSDQHKPMTERINIAQQIAGLSDLFALQLQAKKIELSTEVDADLKVEMAPHDFDIIFRNLIDNSIKFSNPGSTISVTSLDKAQTIHIIVKDEGIGMTQQQIHDIFSLVGERKGQGTHGEQGMGLGMVLVHDLVERYGGGIRVDSEVGIGSSFTVILPKM